MRKKLFFIICLLVGNAAHAYWIYALGGVLVISGKIEKGDRLHVEERLNDEIRKVAITSPGEDVEEGLAIGSIIRRSEKLLVVRRLCASSCALIFAMAHKRAVDEDGFVAFHAGDYEWRLSMLAAVNAYEPNSAAFREYFETQKSEREAAWMHKSQVRESAFKAAGLDYTWHQQVVELTAFEVLGVNVDETTHVIKTTVAPGQCDWWVPDKQAFQEIGIELKNYDLHDKSVVADRLKVPADRIYWNRLSVLKTQNEKPCADPKLNSN